MLTLTVRLLLCLMVRCVALTTKQVIEHSTFEKKITGYFTPPESGTYKFYSSCTVPCTVFLSDSLTEDRLIIQQHNGVKENIYDEFADQVSDPINLQIGHPVFLKAMGVYNRLATNACLSIGVKLPDNGQMFPIGQKHLSEVIIENVPVKETPRIVRPVNVSPGSTVIEAPLYEPSIPIQIDETRVSKPLVLASRKPVITVGSSVAKPVPYQASTVKPVVPVETTLTNPVVSGETALAKPVVPDETTLTNPVIPDGTSLTKPVVPVETALAKPVISVGTTLTNPVVPVGTTLSKPVIPVGTTLTKPIVPVATTLAKPVIQVGTTLSNPVVPVGTQLTKVPKQVETISLKPRISSGKTLMKSLKILPLGASLAANNAMKPLVAHNSSATKHYKKRRESKMTEKLKVSRESKKKLGKQKKKKVRSRKDKKKIKKATNRVKRDIAEKSRNMIEKKITGYFTPPETGEYKFYSSCSSPCNIYLSNGRTDEEKLIIKQTRIVGAHVFDEFPDEASHLIYLTRGAPVFLKASSLYSEQEDSPSLSVGVMLPDDGKLFPISQTFLRNVVIENVPVEEKPTDTNLKEKKKRKSLKKKKTKKSSLMKNLEKFESVLGDIEKTKPLDEQYDKVFEIATDNLEDSIAKFDPQKITDGSQELEKIVNTFKRISKIRNSKLSTKRHRKEDERILESNKERSEGNIKNVEENNSEKENEEDDDLLEETSNKEAGKSTKEPKVVENNSENKHEVEQDHESVSRELEKLQTLILNQNSDDPTKDLKELDEIQSKISELKRKIKLRSYHPNVFSTDRDEKAKEAKHVDIEEVTYNIKDDDLISGMKKDVGLVANTTNSKPKVSNALFRNNELTTTPKLLKMHNNEQKVENYKPNLTLNETSVIEIETELNPDSLHASNVKYYRKHAYNNDTDGVDDTFKIMLPKDLVKEEPLKNETLNVVDNHEEDGEEDKSEDQQLKDSIKDFLWSGKMYDKKSSEQFTRKMMKLMIGKNTSKDNKKIAKENKEAINERNPEIVDAYISSEKKKLQQNSPADQIEKIINSELKTTNIYVDPDGKLLPEKLEDDKNSIEFEPDAGVGKYKVQSHLTTKLSPKLLRQIKNTKSNEMSKLFTPEFLKEVIERTADYDNIPSGIATEKASARDHTIDATVFYDRTFPAENTKSVRKVKNNLSHVFAALKDVPPVEITSDSFIRQNTDTKEKNHESGEEALTSQLNYDAFLRNLGLPPGTFPYERSKHHRANNTNFASDSQNVWNNTQGAANGGEDFKANATASQLIADQITAIFSPNYVNQSPKTLKLVRPIYNRALEQRIKDSIEKALAESTHGFFQRKPTVPPVAGMENRIQLTPANVEEVDKSSKPLTAPSVNRESIDSSFTSTVQSIADQVLKNLEANKQMSYGPEKHIGPNTNSAIDSSLNKFIDNEILKTNPVSTLESKSKYADSTLPNSLDVVVGKPLMKSKVDRTSETENKSEHRGDNENSVEVAEIRALLDEIDVIKNKIVTMKRGKVLGRESKKDLIAKLRSKEKLLSKLKSTKKSLINRTVHANFKKHGNSKRKRRI